MSQKYAVENPLIAVPNAADSKSTPSKSSSTGHGGGFGSLAQTPFTSPGDNALSSTPFAISQGASLAGFENPSSVSNPSPGPSPFLGVISDVSAQSPFGTNTLVSTPGQSPFGSSTVAPAISTQSPFGSSTSSPGPAQSSFGIGGSVSTSFGFGASAQSPYRSSTPAPTPAFSSMSSSSPFGQPNGSSFALSVGQPPLPATPIAAPAGVPRTYLGKSARDLLTAFYQEKNPSKVSEVDNLLAKYLGREDTMFLSLAKKYKLSPSVFGITEAAPMGGFGASGPGMPASPDFGHPSTLGGATFGSPPPSFGGASSAGFGAAASLGPGFGSASGSHGSQGFGALAHSPAPMGFGSFGSSTSPATPFGASSMPFGGPRR